MSGGIIFTNVSLNIQDVPYSSLFRGRQRILSIFVEEAVNHHGIILSNLVSRCVTKSVTLQVSFHLARLVVLRNRTGPDQGGLLMDWPMILIVKSHAPPVNTCKEMLDIMFVSCIVENSSLLDPTFPTAL